VWKYSNFSLYLWSLVLTNRYCYVTIRVRRISVFNILTAHQ
jgi:hypothetical protein